MWTSALCVSFSFSDKQKCCIRRNVVGFTLLVLRECDYELDVVGLTGH